MKELRANIKQMENQTDKWTDKYVDGFIKSRELNRYTWILIDIRYEYIDIFQFQILIRIPIMPVHSSILKVYFIRYTWLRSRCNIYCTVKHLIYDLGFMFSSPIRPAQFIKNTFLINIYDPTFSVYSLDLQGFSLHPVITNYSDKQHEIRPDSDQGSKKPGEPVSLRYLNHENCKIGLNFFGYLWETESNYVLICVKACSWVR